MDSHRWPSDVNRLVKILAEMLRSALKWERENDELKRQLEPDGRDVITERLKREDSSEKDD